MNFDLVNGSVMTLKSGSIVFGYSCSVLIVVTVMNTVLKEHFLCVILNYIKFEQYNLCSTISY